MYLFRSVEGLVLICLLQSWFIGGHGFSFGYENKNTSACSDQLLTIDCGQPSYQCAIQNVSASFIHPINRTDIRDACFLREDNRCTSEGSQYIKHCIGASSCSIISVQERPVENCQLPSEIYQVEYSCFCSLPVEDACPISDKNIFIPFSHGRDCIIVSTHLSTHNQSVESCKQWNNNSLLLTGDFNADLINYVTKQLVHYHLSGYYWWSQNGGVSLKVVGQNITTKNEECIDCDYESFFMCVLTDVEYEIHINKDLKDEINLTLIIVLSVGLPVTLIIFILLCIMCYRYRVNKQHTVSEDGHDKLSDGDLSDADKGVVNKDEGVWGPLSLYDAAADAIPVALEDEENTNHLILPNGHKYAQIDKSSVRRKYVESDGPTYDEVCLPDQDVGPVLPPKFHEINEKMPSSQNVNDTDNSHDVIANENTSDFERESLKVEKGCCDESPKIEEREDPDLGNYENIELSSSVSKLTPNIIKGKQKKRRPLPAPKPTLKSEQKSTSKKAKIQLKKIQSCTNVDEKFATDQAVKKAKKQQNEKHPSSKGRKHKQNIKGKDMEIVENEMYHNDPSKDCNFMDADYSQLDF